MILPLLTRAMRIILSTRIGECDNNDGTQIPNNGKKRKRKDDNEGSEQETEKMSKWRGFQTRVCAWCLD